MAHQLEIIPQKYQVNLRINKKFLAFKGTK